MSKIRRLLIFNPQTRSEKILPVTGLPTELMVENFDESYGTFLNDLPVANRLKLLFNGDICLLYTSDAADD